MKILTILGARPQFVKAAVVSRAIAKYNKTCCAGPAEFAEAASAPIREIIVHTGQHYDANMSEIFFTEMRIPRPHYHLGVGGGSHAVMTGRMLEGLEEIILKEKPDLVLVYGDTNSTLAGALAAVKLHVPIAHVEAGLRSFNLRMPEEVNRILTDRVSRWLFCPTERSVKNLAEEGIFNSNQCGKDYNQKLVYQVGDVMYDAALFYKQIASPTEEIVFLLEKYKKDFYLCTVHRAENTDNLGRLKNIVHALETIAANTPVILPLHPRTRKVMESSDILPRHIHLINPVGYFDMLTLLENCKGVFTDSGGLQKEAYFFGKSCITLREETEWVELVEHGFNQLVGADYERILLAEKDLVKRKPDFTRCLYGNGDAGEKIVEKLIEGCL